MDWLEAVVHTTTMGADIVSEVLMNAGAIGTAIEDRYDVTSSNEIRRHVDMIDEDVLKHMSEDVLVKAYFKSDASAPETLHLVEQKLGEIARMDMGFDMGSLELDTQGVREQDWAENWKKYYKPFRAGEHLVIKPSWEAYEPKEGDLVLELDPGMAFGTGTHETTFMCMEQLEKYITPGLPRYRRGLRKRHSRSGGGETRRKRRAGHRSGRAGGEGRGGKHRKKRSVGYCPRGARRSARKARRKGGRYRGEHNRGRDLLPLRPSEKAPAGKAVRSSAPASSRNARTTCSTRWRRRATPSATRLAKGEWVCLAAELA